MPFVLTTSRKAALFDLDDTIFDYQQCARRSAVAVLQRVNPVLTNKRSPHVTSRTPL
jgi:phosphoglycolate phosphatase-like HAD superfamily hydrolase